MEKSGPVAIILVSIGFVLLVALIVVASQLPAAGAHNEALRPEVWSEIERWLDGVSSPGPV